MNDNLNYQDIFTRLSAPFPIQDIEWRAGATNADKTKALALAYITSRAVMDRLDEVVGPENWKDEYQPGPNGGVICGLSLRLKGEWLEKWDGADNSDIEPIKGGLSDAFKRAGVKWGIGRYLYKLENVWVPCEVRGKSVALTSHPPLPAWALPDDPNGKVVSHRETSPRQPSEREKEILSELGFGDPVHQPVLETQAASVPAQAAPVIPSGNGKNGSKQVRSWNSNIVSALVKAGLAANPPEAVKMLNESGLDANVTPEKAVAHFQSKN